MSIIRGIDVSRTGQGDDFDWKSRPDLSFGMCKATEGGSFTDSALGHNWDAMWWYRPDHRLPRFGYHFFRASVDPVRQAEFFVLTMKKHGLLPGDNLTLDLESNVPGKQLNDGLTPAQVAPLAVECLRTVNELAPGHRVLPYMNPAWARAGGSAGMAAWYLWVAHYGVTRPEIPAPWTQWTFWQYTSSPIDTDAYNGDLASLLAFTRMPDKR